MVVNIGRYDRIQRHQPELINFLRSRRWNAETAYTNRDYSQEYGFTELCFVSDDYFNLMNIKCHHKPGEPFCYVNEQLYQTLQADSTSESFRFQNQVYPVKGLVHIGPDSPSAKTIGSFTTFCHE